MHDERRTARPIAGIAALLLLAAALSARATALGGPAPLPAPAPTAAKAADAKTEARGNEESDKKARGTEAPDNNDGRCDLCDARTCVRKVCVPKPKEREIKKICWSYKCEDFCIPGPSEYCGKTCGKDDCGCWSHDVWKPTCAEVRTKKVPVKTEVKRKVPGVEWVLEERCGACRGKPCSDPSCAAAREP